MEQDSIERHLGRMRRGEDGADEDLLRLLYPQLEALARNARARAGKPMNPGTQSLVHEAYLKLFRTNDGDWENRRHFMSVAARAMRQILVDAARARMADKRGGDEPDRPLRDPDAVDKEHAIELIAVDQALKKLERVSPRLRGVVELRFFAELSIEETAELLQVTTRTVNRDWLKAKLFILRELQPPGLKDS